MSFRTPKTLAIYENTVVRQKVSNRTGSFRDTTVTVKSDRNVFLDSFPVYSVVRLQTGPVFGVDVATHVVQG